MVPSALLICAPRPELPGAAATQRDVALALIALDAAHADCADKLAAVRRILSRPAE